MATAYVVTSGSYSDYGVHRVFTTRVGAEAWIGEGKGDYTSDSYSVEEYPLDDDDDPVVAGMRGSMLLDTGALMCPLNPTVGSVRNEVVVYRGFTAKENFLVMWFGHRDEERCLKVMNEVRAKLRALRRDKPGRYHRETLEPIED